MKRKFVLVYLGLWALFCLSILGLAVSAHGATSPTRTYDPAYAAAFKQAWNHVHPTTPMKTVACKTFTASGVKFADCLTEQEYQGSLQCGELLVLYKSGTVLTAAKYTCKDVNKAIIAGTPKTKGYNP